MFDSIALLGFVLSSLTSDVADGWRGRISAADEILVRVILRGTFRDY